MVVIQRPVDDKIEDELQTLDDEFQDLKAKMSILRKDGKDTTTAETYSLDFLPMLRMARATYERGDITRVKQLLKLIDNELREAEEGSDFDHAVQLIKEAYEHLRNGQLNDARGAYSAVISIYKKLPQDLRRTIYVACLDIQKKIQ